MPSFLQGALSHSLISVLQVGPEKPGGHVQEKDAMPSTQVAPEAQGELRQSSTLISHEVPLKPVLQAHS